MNPKTPFQVRAFAISSRNLSAVDSLNLVYSKIYTLVTADSHMISLGLWEERILLRVNGRFVGGLWEVCGRSQRDLSEI